MHEIITSDRKPPPAAPYVIRYTHLSVSQTTPFSFSFSSGGDSVHTHKHLHSCIYLRKVAHGGRKLQPCSSSIPTPPSPWSKSVQPPRDRASIRRDRNYSCGGGNKRHGKCAVEFGTLISSGYLNAHQTVDLRAGIPILSLGTLQIYILPSSFLLLVVIVVVNIVKTSRLIKIVWYISTTTGSRRRVQTNADEISDTSKYIFFPTAHDNAL